MSVNNLIDSGNPAESWKNLRVSKLVIDSELVINGDIGTVVSLPAVSTQYKLDNVIEETFDSDLVYTLIGQVVHLSLSSPSTQALVDFDTIQIFSTEAPPSIEHNVSILISISSVVFNSYAIVTVGGTIIAYPPSSMSVFPQNSAIYLPYQVINYLL